MFCSWAAAAPKPPATITIVATAGIRIRAIMIDRMMISSHQGFDEYPSGSVGSPTKRPPLTLNEAAMASTEAPAAMEAAKAALAATKCQGRTVQAQCYTDYHGRQEGHKSVSSIFSFSKAQ
ncbi:MAG: hypothetical protein M3178_02095 [Pseudomonadota bacterium]|nr:hypothetical protein [Pseudomonadota bacterium]